MGPGSDCPPHLVRHPTAASIAKLARRFDLEDGLWMQDWEVQVADFSRVAEFLDAYDSAELDADDRFLLMEVIVASLDEGAHMGAQLENLWRSAERVLRGDPKLHTLSYWSCGDDPDPEHQFARSPRSCARCGGSFSPTPTSSDDPRLAKTARAEIL